jgi:hypothetical protein
MSYLSDIVSRKIRELGIPASAEYFEVQEALIRQWDRGSKRPSLEAVEKVFRAPEFEPDGKVKEAEWDGKKVVMLLPWYKSTSPITAFSVMGLLDKTKVSVIMSFGDAFIAHTRNKLAHQFLKTDVEWAFWVDDDMIIPWGNAAWFNAYSGYNLPSHFAGMHALNRLMSHGKTLVGGCYFGRRWGGRPVYSEGASSKEEAEYVRRGPHDTLKPTRWVGTGAMLMHRSVLLDVELKFPELRRVDDRPGHWFTSSEHDLLQASTECLDILDDKAATSESRVARVREILHDGRHRSMAHSKLGMGEDVQFCIRAAQAGHQAHVDLGLLCGHVGSYCFGPRSHD